MAIRTPHYLHALLVSALLGAGQVVAAGLPGKDDLNAELATANQLLAEGKYPEAYKAYLEHAEDNQLAQFNLGLIEMYGWGRAADPVAACNWFEPSAAEDIPLAQELLGDCYRDGTHQPRDFDQARTWYMRAVDNGLPQASCKLGKIYIEGKLVEQDVRKGVRLCERGGEAGSVEAQLYLATNFERGDGYIPGDVNRALYWYSMAAGNNVTEAQYHIARLLRSQGTNDEGYQVALDNAETAAASGYQPAYLLTAQLYMQAPLDHHTNMPTPTNLAKAYMWSQATIRGADDEQDKRDAQALLKRIRTVMPSEWEKDLDGEVDDHFERLAAQS